MSKARRKTIPVIPTSCIFDIPLSYQETISHKRFLLMDFFLKRGKERVIVFSTEAQLQLLFTSKTIFIDGTFGGAPAGFEQLFLIHVQHFGQGKDIIFCKVIGFIFSVMKRFTSGVLCNAEPKSQYIYGNISTIKARSNCNGQTI